jgi:hypothetical protein
MGVTLTLVGGLFCGRGQFEGVCTCVALPAGGGAWTRQCFSGSALVYQLDALVVFARV